MRQTALRKIYLFSIALALTMATALAVAAIPGPAIPSPKGTLIVNINTATRSELQSLPNVGPSIAIGIIAGRPYKSAGELARVSGISRGQARLMSKYVVVTGATRKIEE
jgi:DNA uptake protein ComE-like DNA-binding protein